MIRPCNNGSWEVGLPNGHTRAYPTLKRARAAALMAKAVATMPIIPSVYEGHTSCGKYGQGSALARALEYWTNNERPGVNPNHARIFNLLYDGHLPRSPERLEKLHEIAARMPDDWFEQCPCLAEHEAEHQHEMVKGA